MELVTFIASGELMKHIKRYTVIFAVDATISFGIAHMWNMGYKSLASAICLCCITLQCLINNAATMIFGEFEWLTEDQIRSQVEVNFLGNMRVTRELMSVIRAHSSRIIVISSHCHIQPIPGVAAYSGTKAAITAWATAIRIELKKYGVKVVCFIPGIVSAVRNDWWTTFSNNIEEKKTLYLKEQYF